MDLCDKKPRASWIETGCNDKSLQMQPDGLCSSGQSNAQGEDPERSRLLTLDLCGSVCCSLSQTAAVLHSAYTIAVVSHIQICMADAESVVQHGIHSVLVVNGEVLLNTPANTRANTHGPTLDDTCNIDVHNN